jgi:signal transduction histidine kinase
MTMEAEIRLERLIAAFGQIPVAVLVTVVNAVIMATALLSIGWNSFVHAWVVAVVLVSAARLILWNAFRRAGPGILRHPGWVLASVAGAGAAGLLWGGGSVLLLPPSETYQLLWVFLIAGMCAGAAGLHHAHLPTALAFIVPAGLPLALRFALDGSERRAAAAGMIVVFVAALAAASRRSSAYFGATLRLRLELARRTEELDAINARLRMEVAEHRATEARLRHAQKMEAAGQLAGGIAHDFNNGLQAVQSGAGLIERRAADPEAVRRLARMLLEAAARGSTVTHWLLVFSRRGDLRAEAVDPVSMLADLSEILTHTVGAGVQVRVEFAPGLPPLLADKGQLETVLVNLATNARDAMMGRGVITLTAVAEMRHDNDAGDLIPLRAGSYVKLQVTDTGAGMDEATLARVTEPFFTTKTVGKAPDWAWPWRAASPSSRGAGCTSRARPGAAQRSACGCRSTTAPRPNRPPATERSIRYRPTGARACLSWTMTRSSARSSRSRWRPRGTWSCRRNPVRPHWNCWTRARRSTSW